MVMIKQNSIRRIRMQLIVRFIEIGFFLPTKNLKQIFRTTKRRYQRCEIEIFQSKKKIGFSFQIFFLFESIRLFKVHFFFVSNFHPNIHLNEHIQCVSNNTENFCNQHL